MPENMKRKLQSDEEPLEVKSPLQVLKDALKILVDRKKHIDNNLQGYINDGKREFLALKKVQKDIEKRIALFESSIKQLSKTTAKK